MRDDDTMLAGMVDDIAAGRRPPPTPDEIAAHGAATDTPRGPLGVAAAARLFGLSPHTLRYYDTAGLVRVARAANGHRLYDREALSDLLMVHRLRQSGMSIQMIGEVMALMRESTDSPEAAGRLRAHADALRRRIAELQISLAIAEHKADVLGRTPGPAPLEPTTGATS